MRGVILFLSIVLLSGSTAFAQKKTTTKPAAEPATKTATKPVVQQAPPKVEKASIKWLSIDDLQAKMKEKPKKVYMDMYTGWCGWCKKMDATTFENPAVIDYMNENFYCVKFDAERKDTIRFMGKYYYFDPAVRANTLAAELMRNQLSYPTTIIMEERYMNPQPIPGYLNVNQMEMILKYFGENLYKSQPWPDYQKAFVAKWPDNSGPVSAPAGH